MFTPMILSDCVEKTVIVELPNKEGEEFGSTMVGNLTKSSSGCIVTNVTTTLSFPDSLVKYCGITPDSTPLPFIVLRFPTN